jgi:tetratricopeptide (TPR) repeat protein
LAKNPDNVFALHNLGTLYIRKKEDYQTGLTYLKKAVELKEKRELTQEEIFKLSNTFHAIGETYFENLNQPAAALPYLENSYAIAPDNVVTMLDLVSVYAEVKQETKAKEMLMKAYAFATERQYKHFYGDIKKAAKKLGLKKEIQL